METKNYIPAFKKYISGIIVPKYPEIESFDVEFSRNADWEYERAVWVPVIKITFYVKSLKEPFYGGIRNDINNMKELFSIGQDLIHIDWRYFVNGYWYKGEWYR